ncbi:hypothetical protein [Marinococcus luteus]|uniref:hypothetical protein n=1 Tax=Marinococcus luteus TaxID=1122204 RepID=UPI002ACD1EA1|nr:hypothetical protein [Marinococcus luteus]MDZ5781892.1 hypothetical protein [Marinococcus luteus]
MKAYTELEKYVVNLFLKEKFFIWKEKRFEVDIVDKPRPRGSGECKTDVYVRGFNKFEGNIELKISIKKENSQEFQENKLTPEATENLLGEDWETIVRDASYSIKEKFESVPLIFLSQRGHTDRNSVTMGWKLEITSKPRNLSSKLKLSDEDIKERVYKGTKLPISKKDSTVNGSVVSGSGIANYMLITEIDKISTVQDVLNQLILIETMPIGDMYLVFTANNWRVEKDSTDGPRCLAVRIEWEEKNGRLIPAFIYDQPLNCTGKKNKEHLKLIFDKLGVQLPDQLNEGMVDSRYIYSK